MGTHTLKAGQGSYLPDLKQAVGQYIAGDISSADLKHTAAPFGIYEQRDGMFMVRIRITGGHLTLRSSQIIADVMRQFDIGFVHLTTRQNLQLHGVAAENICSIVDRLVEQGIPFRGGGGNTYRNIIVSTESGIAPDTVFDVLPYGNALNDFMLYYEKAFDLPRKLKIGFSASPADRIHADLQDLGFIAKIDDGKRGFEVYAGGGMGKNSRRGIKLFNFLPESDFAKCAQAITDLFYDYGDRSNRNKARLRYLLNVIGEEDFYDLCMKYFNKSDVELKINKEDLRTSQEIFLRTSQKLDREKPLSNAVGEWSAYAASDTLFGDNIKTLTLFVPQGDLKTDQLDKINNLLKLQNLNYLRISQTQDFVLPPLSISQFSTIYSYLKNELGEIDLTLDSFRGHVLSCIGSSVCKIGVVNAPSFASLIANALDNHFRDKAGEKLLFIKNMLNEIRISGCPNSCSGHFSAKIGLYGMKKRVNDQLIEGALLKLGDAEAKFIPVSELSSEILKLSTSTDAIKA